MTKTQVQIVFWSLLSGLATQVPEDILRDALKMFTEDEGFWRAIRLQQSIQAEPGKMESLAREMIERSTDLIAPLIDAESTSAAERPCDPKEGI